MYLFYTRANYVAAMIYRK